MSLINQMMRDLEARREPVAAAPGLAVADAPVERNSLPSLKAIAFAAVAGVICALALIFFWPQAVPEAVPVVAAEPVAVEETPVVEAVKPEPAGWQSAQPSEPVLKAPIVARGPEPVPAKQTEPVQAQPTKTAPPVVEKVAAPAAPVMVKQVRKLSLAEQVQQLTGKAAVAIREGDLPTAREHLQQSLVLVPGHALASRQLARLLAGTDPQTASDVLTRALAVNESNADIRMELARLLAASGKADAALELLRAEEAPAARALVAGLYQQQGDNQQAIEVYRGLLTEFPDRAVWWMGLGISLQAEGRRDEALNAYSKSRASGSLSAALDQFVQSRMSALAATR